MLTQELEKHNEANKSIPNQEGVSQAHGAPAGADQSTGGSQSWVEHAEAELSSPRLVIRGAQIQPPTPLPPQKTTVDYLAFTTTDDVALAMELVSMHIPANFQRLQSGWQGYKHRYQIMMGANNIGLIAFGGQNDTVYVSLSGQGCNEVKSWENLYRDLSTLEGISMKRCDLAFTTCDPRFNHQTTYQAYLGGKFKNPMSRVNPCHDPREPKDEYGRPIGFTHYFGRRDGCRFGRTYSKSSQIVNTKLRDNPAFENAFKLFLNKQLAYTLDDGTEMSAEDFYNLYRFEIEYKAKNYIIPLDMILERDKYFAGAYPYFAEVLEMTDVKKPKAMPNNNFFEEETMFMHIRNQYGAFLTTQLAMGKTPEEILSRICNGKMHQGTLKNLSRDEVESVKPFDMDKLKNK